jgi:signal transduction histidine kinase
LALLPRLNHRLIFASALSLLLLSGAGLAWTSWKTYSSEKWVRHTYSVELLLSDITFDLNKTGRDRQIYLDTGDERVLRQMKDTRDAISGKLAQLKSMVSDNSDQESASARFERVIEERFATFDQSLRLFQSGKSTSRMQDRYTQELIAWAQQTSTLAREMQEAESRLLDRRTVNTRSLFRWAIFIAACSYLISLYVLWEHYRGLTRELCYREVAERNALKLSAQLLGAQDQERRKIARDLHDGLGQVLVGAKMTADSLLKGAPDNQKMLELSAMLAEAVSSTRSLSHLLHPPLVEELGFSAAARSYVEGFSKRTGVQVTFELPEPEERLSRELELALFRILQEALTNIQRHSKSATAEVKFRTDRQTATLKLRDFGVGLPPGITSANGSNLGVGLAGMKERVREHNGQFEIHSDSNGTLISVTFPVALERLTVERPDPAADSPRSLTKAVPG